MATGRAEEAARFFSVAAGVRPRSGLALSGLGKALLLIGQPAEAADTFREVTRLRPDDALAHVALGTALLALGEPQEADVEFGEARRLRPDDWMVRDQIALAYSDRGDWAAAVEEQRESARRFPKLAVVHKALAHALQSSGRLDEAVAEFREAVRLDPRFSAAYLFLGRALIEAGDLQAALDALARVDVGPPPPDPILTASSLAARAERMIALGARLPAVAEGRDRPADPEELAAFARLAFARRQHAASARLWAEAFAASPALAADIASQNRFQAARAAALAGTEGGPERPPLRRAIPGAMAGAGPRLARSRPRRLLVRPGFGRRPAACGGRPEARALAGRPGAGGDPRRADPGRDLRIRAPIAPRILGPGRRPPREGRLGGREGTGRCWKSVGAAVTSGEFSPTGWMRDEPPGVATSAAHLGLRQSPTCGARPPRLSSIRMMIPRRGVPTVRPCRVHTPARSRPQVGRCSHPVRNARESAS